MSMTTELIDGLRSMALQYSAMGVPETEKIMKQAANVIEELSAKVAQQNMEKSSQYYNGGWIPVEERLPEIDVIGFDGINMYSKDMLVALHWYDGDVTVETGWYNRNGSWSNESKNCEVIAWQPLPPVYKPKDVI